MSWGLPGDIPVPGDYNDDGSVDRAVYSASTGVWWVHGQAPILWGVPGDLAVPGDFNGDGATDAAVYRPSTGIWYVRNLSTVAWGLIGDVPAARPYLAR